MEVRYEGDYIPIAFRHCVHCDCVHVHYDNHNIKVLPTTAFYSGNLDIRDILDITEIPAKVIFGVADFANEHAVSLLFILSMERGKKAVSCTIQLRREQ